MAMHFNQPTSRVKLATIDNVKDFNRTMELERHYYNLFTYNGKPRKHGFVLYVEYNQGGKGTQFFKTQKLAVQKLQSIK